MTFRRAAAQVMIQRRMMLRAAELSVIAVANATLTAAKKRSSGTWSLAELAAKDYPYARRHGTSRLDPSIINRQTGTFYGGWYVTRTGPMSFAVCNDTAVAGYLKNGTKFMVPRPIDKAIEAQMNLRAAGIFVKASRGVFTG